MAAWIERLILIVAAFGSIYFVLCQGVSLTRTSKYELEGYETSFTCTVASEANTQREIYGQWKLDNSQLEDFATVSKSILNITLTGDNLKSTLSCQLRGQVNSSASWTLNVTRKIDPPTRVTLDVNSTIICDDIVSCNAIYVQPNETYQFTCIASGSREATDVSWWIRKPEGSDIERLAKPPNASLARQDEDGSRQTSEQINLQILPGHNSSSIMCRAVFLDTNTYEESEIKLLMVDVQRTTDSTTVDTTVTETATETDLTITPGFVTKPPAGYVVVIIPTVVLGFACIVLAVACKVRRRAKQSQGSKETDATVSQIEKRRPLEESVLGNYDHFKRARRDYSFPREKIALQDVLGSGHFGQVYKATADGILKEGVNSEVAVKILKKSATDDVVADFEKEISIHKALKKHPNIVCMLGYSTETAPFYLILEYLSGGNLQQFLRDKKEKWQEAPGDDTQPASPYQLLTFASQIASGMDYLSSSVGCIHRDLASRNILLDEELVCKLSDFGLARDISESEQYEKTSLGLIPVRWLAIECLLENKYTTMSDVWSFGVLLWEIVTLGSHPYRGMSANDVIDSIVEGYRLPTPVHCGKQLYTIMKECWRISPNRRPTFTDLRRILDIIIPDAPIYLQMENFVADTYV